MKEWQQFSKLECKEQKQIQPSRIFYSLKILPVPMEVYWNELVEKVALVRSGSVSINPKHFDSGQSALLIIFMKKHKI